MTGVQTCALPISQSSAPQDLLAQMQQMLAALNADLVQLDADLQAPPPGGGHS